MGLKEWALYFTKTQHMLGFIQALICIAVLSWLANDSDKYREKKHVSFSCNLGTESEEQKCLDLFNEGPNMLNHIASISKLNTALPIVCWLLLSLITLYRITRITKFANGVSHCHLGTVYCIQIIVRIIVFLGLTVFYCYYFKILKVPSVFQCSYPLLKNSTNECRDKYAGDKTEINYGYFASNIVFLFLSMAELIYTFFKWQSTFHGKCSCKEGEGCRRGGRCLRCQKFLAHWLTLGKISKLCNDSDGNESSPERGELELQEHISLVRRDDPDEFHDESNHDPDTSTITIETTTILGSSAKERFRRDQRIRYRNLDIKINSKILEIDQRERKNCFGQLKIVKTPIVNKYFAEENPQHFLKRISEVKENISPTDLLSNDNKQCFLRGIAGIGKSSFVEYLTFMWADSQWYRDMFDYIFLIECRLFEEDIDDKYPETYLETFIKENCNVESLPRNGEKVLIIIDGLDEFYELEEALDRKDSRINCLLSKTSRFLQGHFTILTARPHVEHFFISNQSMNPFRHFEITGLDPDQIENFVMVFAEENQEIANQIVAKIKASPSIKALASVPQYLQILCSITKDSDEVIRMENITPLYTWMFICLWIKHIGKDRPKLLNYREFFEDEDVAWFLKQLCAIAYDLFMDHKIIFTKESFSELFESERLQSSKIRAMFNAFITERKKTGTYQFRHLTLHEFFAAADCYRKNIPIDELLSKDLFQMVRFIGGFYGADAADENDQERLVVKSFINCIKSSDPSPVVNQENAGETCHNWFLNLFKKLELIKRGRKHVDSDYPIEVLKEAYEFANSLSPRIHHICTFYINHKLPEADIDSLATFLDILKEKELLSILHICDLVVEQLNGSRISTILSYIPKMEKVVLRESVLDMECLSQLQRNFSNDDVCLKTIFFNKCIFEGSCYDALADIITKIPDVQVYTPSGVDEDDLLSQVLTRLNDGKKLLRKLFLTSSQTYDSFKKYEEFQARFERHGIHFKHKFVTIEGCVYMVEIAPASRGYFLT